MGLSSNLVFEELVDHINVAKDCLAKRHSMRDQYVYNV